MQTGLEAVVDSHAVTGWKTGKALIDSGAELNLVSQLFVKEAGWQLRPDAGPPAKAIDGRSIHIYGSLKITTRITDRDGKTTQRRDEFVATDLQGYDFVLGEPWLQTRNPDIDWVEKTWAYTERSESPQPLMAHAFLAEASKAKRIFAIRYTMQPSTEPELPPEYEEFRDVFSEEEANKLAPRGRQDHAIEIDGEPP